MGDEVISTCHLSHLQLCNTGSIVQHGMPFAELHNGENAPRMMKSTCSNCSDLRQTVTCMSFTHWMCIRLQHEIVVVLDDGLDGIWC